MYHLFISYAIYRKMSKSATYKAAIEHMQEGITTKSTSKDGVIVEIEKYFFALPSVTSPI